MIISDNPTDIVAGNQHWGHATSPDLYHWANQPIALFPPNASSGVFSGSAVIDTNNTSGFFPDQDNGVVAIYTLNTPTAQVQQIAYSKDGGYSFEEYEGNPVLDVGLTQFRDPKVIWYEDHWVMAVAFPVDYVIGVYTSPDLKSWTHASNISHVGFLGLQYECPNLVSIPIANSSDSAWVLTISINPGSPLGGSITQYFPGEFNGTHFTPFDSAARLTNFGKDDYAGQFFYDEPVSIGWASNWQYTNFVPTGEEGWRSAMTLPRKNYFTNITAAGWDLVQEVYDFPPVLGDQLDTQQLVNKSSTVTFTEGAYIDVNFTIPEDAFFAEYASLNFTICTDSSGETVKGGYFFADPYSIAAWLDRGDTKAFESPFFTDKFSAAPVCPTALPMFFCFVFFNANFFSFLSFPLNNISLRYSSTTQPRLTKQRDSKSLSTAAWSRSTSITVHWWAQWLLSQRSHSQNLRLRRPVCRMGSR